MLPATPRSRVLSSFLVFIVLVAVFSILSIGDERDAPAITIRVSGEPGTDLVLRYIPTRFTDGRVTQLAADGAEIVSVDGTIFELSLVRVRLLKAEALIKVYIDPLRPFHPIMDPASLEKLLDRARISTPLCDARDPMLDKIIPRDLEGEELFEKLVENVRTYVEYDPNEFGLSSSAALRLGRASCDGLARIVVAAARRAGYPAVLAYGYLASTGARHAWAEVFYGGRWHVVDPTFRLLDPPSRYYLRAGCSVDGTIPEPLSSSGLARISIVGRSEEKSEESSWRIALSSEPSLSAQFSRSRLGEERIASRDSRESSIEGLIIATAVVTILLFLNLRILVRFARSRW